MKKILLCLGCCLSMTVWSCAQNTQISDKNFYADKVKKIQMPEEIKKIHSSYVEKARKIQTALQENGTVTAQELKELSELYRQIMWSIINGPQRNTIAYYLKNDKDNSTFTYVASTTDMLKNVAENNTVKIVSFDTSKPETTTVQPSDIFKAGDWTAFETDFPYYIPLYDRESGEIVSCLLLYAGIDGRIDNKIGNGEKIYTDEWRKKIKAYNLWETEIRDQPFYFGTFVEETHREPQKYKDTEMPGGMTMTTIWPLSIEDLMNGGKDLIMHVGSNVYINPDGSIKLKLKE